jgi:hypothetical protein
MMLSKWCYSKALLDMRHDWTKNTFRDAINKKWCKCCKFVSPFLFKNTYDLPVSQWTPHVQLKYFMFDRLIYRLFVLSSTWKRDSLQIILFAYVCSTLGIVELKMSFVVWITRDDVICASFFHLSCLITLMANLCWKETPNIKMKYFMYDWSIYSLFVLNMTRKRDSLQIMLFGYECSTWGIVEL